MKAKKAWASENNYGHSGLERLRDDVQLGVMTGLGVNKPQAFKMATDMIEGRKTLMDKLVNLEPIRESELNNAGSSPSLITKWGYERGDRGVYRHPKAVAKPKAEKQATKPGESLDIEDKPEVKPKGESLYSIKFEPSKPSPATPSAVTDPQKFEPLPKDVRRDQIISNIKKTIGTPIRIGKFNKANAAGIFKTHQKVIRLKQANDIDTAFHEVGHDIQQVMGIAAKQIPEAVRAIATPGDPIKEGFAEFTRLYVMDPVEAMRVSPEFYATFEKALEPHNELQQLFQKVRQAQELWRAATSVQKVASFISSGKEQKSGQWPSLSKIYTEIKDDLWPIKKLVDYAKKQGGNIPANRDPYILGRLFRGWAREAEQYLKIGTYQRDPKGTITKTGPPLVKILSKIERDGERPLLDTYLVAKRAVSDERIQKGFKGILSLEDFKQTVKELEPKYGEVAQQLYKYSNELLTYLVDAGRISKETAEAIRAKNVFYAPLYRIIEEFSQVSGNLFAGKSLANVTNPIKKLKGSARQIVSPTESLMRNTFAIINAAERNRVGDALLDMMKNVEGLGGIVEQIPFPVKPEKISKDDFLKLLNKYGDFKSVQNVTETEKVTRETLSGLTIAGKTAPEKMVEKAMEALRARGWTEGEAKQIIRRIQEGKTLDDKREVVRETVEKTIIKVVKEELDLGEMPDSMVSTFRPAYRAGPREAIFYKDGKPVLVEFGDEEIAKAFGAVSAHDINLMVKFMAYPAKWLRAGATTFSPEFGIRNPLRDQQTAFMQSKYGFVPFVDLTRGMFHVLGKTDLYKEFNASGAAHAALVSMDRKYISKNLRKMVRDDSRKFNAVMNPLELLQRISELTEEATRVGEFARGIKKEGRTPEGLAKAGLAARDVSMDFSRQGGTSAWTINAISAFWNARMEGLDRIIQVHKENPTKAFIKGFLSTTIPTLLFWYMQKDDEAYQELPAWRKMVFWNIVWRGGDGKVKVIIPIPKGFEWGMLYGSMPEAAMNWAVKNDKRGMGEALKQFGESMNFTPLPTGVVPVVEWWANKSLFFDRPIVPPDAEDLEPQLQYTPHTSETMKLAAEVMAKVPGLKKIASPAKLENTLRGLTGGFGTMITMGVDWALEQADLVHGTPKPAKTLMEMPGFRAFNVRFPSSDTQSLKRFYEYYYELKVKRESEKERMGVRDLGLQGMNQTFGMQREDATYMWLSALRKQAKMVYESKEMDPKIKRETLDEIYSNMMDTARIYYGKVPLK